MVTTKVPYPKLVTANDVWMDLTLLISTISINKKTLENLRQLKITPWLNEKHTS